MALDISCHDVCDICHNMFMTWLSVTEQGSIKVLPPDPSNATLTPDPSLLQMSAMKMRLRTP